ncbi:hypothetical protein ACHAXA_009737 [Cyclostephanos tholiformis]|uniref:PIN-like protein n=1 Tax=Cyclostephanos tholiformis TaxID=382380 RepID=A0ABD3RGH5_9STRA
MASSLGPTFLASSRAVGTAATMMGAGFYLQRQNYVTPQGKTMLALIAQQVTIPAFLFAKIIYCPSDHGDGSGGSDAPEFFSSSTELGRVDPTAFLSVYLLLYPVLQWGLGGWLLAPAEHADNEEEIGISFDVKIGVPSIDRGAVKNGTMEKSPLLPKQDSTNSEGVENGFQLAPGRSSFRISHILNYESHHQSATAAAEQEIFGSVMPSKRRNGGQDRWNTAGYNNCPPPSVLQSMVKELSFSSLRHLGGYEEPLPDLQTFLQPEPESFESIDGPPTMEAVKQESSSFIDFNCPAKEFESTPKLTKQQIRAIQRADILPLTDTLLRISGKVFQPPVTAALLGLFIASFHNLRGIFVNIYGDKGKQAPLQFIFDGIYTVGQSAVPINMIILGINLSSTFQKKSKKVVGKDDMDLPNKTMFALVVAKMIVMPVIEVDATCYLVMMIVFITPTANNVMIMVELSGSSSKEGMARLIGWQYVVSPVVLSLVLSKVVGLASCHFDTSRVCEL